MISRRLKGVYYTVAAPAMRLNGAIYRRLRAPRSGLLRVHLGPGQKNYLAGWINVDANALTGKVDVWADLRNPLPFRDGTIDAFYSHHVVEHLPDLPAHFAELARCLKPGGVLRIGGPNGDAAIDRFIANDSAWFGDFPDKRASIGGRFENFIFCRQEHLTILTLSYLGELCAGAGLELVGACLPTRDTHFPALFDAAVLALEVESDFVRPKTLIIEAVKP